MKNSFLVAAGAALFISSSAMADKFQKFDHQFDKNISEKIEHNQDLADALKKITKRSKSDWDGYGGTPGRAYFKVYNESVIQPTLLATLNEMKEDKQDADLFVRLLYKLGEQRGKIAETVSKKDTGASTYRGGGTPFGKMDIDRIEDAVGAYPAWAKYLKAKITSDLTFGELLENEDISMTQTERILLNSKEFAELPTRLGKALYGSVEKSREGFDITGAVPHVFGKMSVNVVDEILTKTGKRAEKGGGYIILGSMYFHHRHSSRDELKEQVAPYFYKALNSSTEEDLKDSLGILLLRMSHQTLYARGQAGMTLWVLQGLARTHGYQLEFSPEWQGPEYPNPDMYALSYFDEAKFLKTFKKNAFLKPLTKK